MTRIYVDGRPYEADAGNHLLAACLSLGFDIPYFCWHPALGSVGSCRLCAVKKFRDEKDKQGKIVMSCLEPVVEGLRISIDDPEARGFRARVIEWLMLNHPHDCPVCDEGGECHLQDMTVLTGHSRRRFRFKKRTFRNQDLGPFVNHEMNRCIQCYRCVRFYRAYAGGGDFSDFAARDRVFFGRFEDGPLQSEFSGNLVEVCPTGVFTDKTLKRHYARKWDLSTGPSVCVHCGLGCNTLPGERYGTLRCVRNRFNGEVNGDFLCDRGRYGYEFASGDRRIARSRAKPGFPARAEGGGEGLLSAAAGFLRAGTGAIGIGSPRASLEANYALRRLVGAENFYAGVSDREWASTALALDILRKGPAPAASLKDARESDAVLVLGDDPTHTAPLLALALRQAVRQKPLEAAVRAGIPLWHDLAVRDVLQDARGFLFIASPVRTKLAPLGQEALLNPEQIAALGFSVSHSLSGAGESAAPRSPDSGPFAEKIARALESSSRPLIVAGVGGGGSILRAAANIAWALRKKGRAARLALTLPECDSLGLALLQGRPLSEAMERVRRGTADTLIVLENDLYRRAEKPRVDELLEKCRTVVLDHIETRTAAKADVVFAAAAFAEAEGTFVNSEGRAQRSFKVYAPPAEIRESWRWLMEILDAASPGGEPKGRDFDALTRALSAAVPALAGIERAAPPAGFLIQGQKIPRESPRSSGRTAVHADREISEPAPPGDPESPLAFSMEGWPGQPPAALLTRIWSPGWNSVQAVSKLQSAPGGPLRGGDPGIRLISAAESAPEPFEVPPAALAGPDDGDLLCVALPHIFGSEELSALSPGIASRIPPLFLRIHPDDARRLGLDDGSEAELEIGCEKAILEVKADEGLAPGLAGLPDGRPDFPWLDLPARGRIRPLR